MVIPYKVIASLLPLVAILCACSSRMPEDINFDNVEAVAYNDPAVNDAEKVLKLRLDFSTDLDLADFISGRYTLSGHPFFCDRPEDWVMLGGIAIYQDGEKIGYMGPASAVSLRGEAGRPFRYYTILEVARRPGPSGSKPDIITGSVVVKPETAFDLRDDPRDVCFFLSGGTFGHGYRSNTIVIPAEAIDAALRRASSDLRSLPPGLGFARRD